MVDAFRDHRLAGGIVAGRLCGTSNENTAGWHGLIAQATATLVVFALLTSAEAARKGVAKASTLGTTAPALGALPRGSAAASACRT